MHIIFIYNPYSIVNERPIAKIDAGRHTLSRPPRMFAVSRFTAAGSPRKSGGADRDRTDDPLLAKQVLSQLSYSPGSEVRGQKAEGRSQTAARSACCPHTSDVMVGLGRFELPTSRLSGVRSNQLSYRPVQTVPATCAAVFDCQRAGTGEPVP